MFLLILACLLACISLMAVFAWLFFFFINLQIATGPMGSAGQKFLAAFGRTLAEEHPRVRLKVVPMSDMEARMKALAAGEVDLAVVRTDMLTGTVGKTFAILRRDVVGLIVPAP